MSDKKWSERDIGEVWFNSFSSMISARDPWGKEIFREEYGVKSEFGWVIDHINPVSNGGNDKMSNLQPLHWKTNNEKGDTLKCVRDKKC